MTTKNGGPSERTLNLLDAALNLRQAGEFTRALEVLRDAENEAPNYAPIHLLMGLTYRDIGELDKAEAELRRAVELDRKQAEALQSLGLLLLSRSRTAEAIALLKRHLQIKPNDPLTLKTIAAEMARAERHEEALHILKDAWHKSGGVDAGITYGRYLIRVNQRAEAESVLRELAETNPEPKTLIEWAYALVLLQEYEQAKRVLLQLVEAAPEFDRAWRGLTECHISLGEFEAALEAADSALAINDRHCRNWYAKTIALMAIGRYDEALEAARKGIEHVPPDDAEAVPVLQELWLREYQALFFLGRGDEALSRLDALRRMFPGEERFVHIQVAALNRLGRSEDALRVLDDAVRAGLPKDGALAPLRYETLHLLGKPDEALEFIRPMLSVQTERRLNVLGDIGVSLYCQGRTEPARRVFAQLHQLAPNNPRFMNDIAFILIGAGELERAEELLMQALEARDSPQMRPLILANLGYIHLVRGEIARARHFLSEALATPDAERSAILRVAFWDSGRIWPSEVAHPRDFLPIRLAVNANLVTASLAEGHLDEAESLVRKMIEDTPESPWGHRMMGWVALAKGDTHVARQAWRQALERTKDPEERQVLERWLDHLPQ